MPDRRVDVLARERVVELEIRYRRVAHRLTIGFGLMTATLMVVSVVLVGLVHDNQARARQIQQERARSIRANCKDSNDRHDNSIAALDTVLHDYLAKKPPAQRPALRKQLEAARQQNILLINALVPKRNCAQVVRGAVGNPNA